jgi:hypothetical protein
MPPKIQTTGDAEYLDGSANIKFMVVGYGDAGKTRFASYTPRPIYLDCENSRGSLFDRAMPFIEIKTSSDMLDALEYLRKLERIPKSERQYQTVVVDTLDSFQRKLKDEWVRDQNAAAFRGFDAWGFLDSKMQMLLTRLLNLDYNVIVNVHPVWEKNYSDDDSPGAYALQLDGKIQNQIFNDFALVAFMGSYTEHDPSTGEAVERRGLKFKKTPSLPFLKDRFNLFKGRWLPVEFCDNDWLQIVQAFADRADEVDMPKSEIVEQLPPADPTDTPHVVPPLAGGPVDRPAAKTKDVLLQEAKDLGLKISGNALKAEIIAAIEKERVRRTPIKAEFSTPESDSRDESQPDNVVQLPGTTEKKPTEEPMTAEEVADKLGATVVAEHHADPEPANPEPEPAPKKKPAEPTKTCEECGTDLAGENQDYVAVAWIKYRRRLCNRHFEAVRAGA